MNQISLDMHCHLVPVANERLADMAGVAWRADKGTLEVDGVLVQPPALYKT